MTLEPATGPTQRPCTTPPASWNLHGLGWIAIGHGISDFYSGAVPLIVFYDVARAHASPLVQGSLVFIWYLTSSIVQPLFGAYSDRRGRWWFMPAAIVATALCVSLMGLASSLWLVAGLLVAGGFGSAIMHPEAGKYSAMLSGARKAGGISIFQIGGQVGFALGPVAAGLALGRWGGSGTAILAPLGLIAVAFLAARMRAIDASAQRAHRAERMGARRAGESPKADRFGIALLVGSTALRHFVSAAFVTYLPNLLTSRGMSLADAGAIVTAFLMVAAVGLFAGGFLADRFGAITVSLASLAGAAPLLLSFFWFGGAAGIALLLGGATLLAVQNAPGVALVQALLPRNLGMALGLMNGVAFGAGSAAVAAAGAAVGRAGPAATLEAISYGPLLAAAAFAVVGFRKGAVARLGVASTRGQA